MACRTDYDPSGRRVIVLDPPYFEKVITCYRTFQDAYQDRVNQFIDGFLINYKENKKTRFQPFDLRTMIHIALGAHDFTRMREITYNLLNEITKGYYSGFFRTASDVGEYFKTLFEQSKNNPILHIFIKKHIYSSTLKVEDLLAWLRYYMYAIEIGIDNLYAYLVNFVSDKKLNELKEVLSEYKEILRRIREAAGRAMKELEKGRTGGEIIGDINKIVEAFKNEIRYIEDFLYEFPGEVLYDEERGPIDEFVDKILEIIKENEEEEKERKKIHA